MYHINRYWVNSTGRRNTSMMRCCDARNGNGEGQTGRVGLRCDRLVARRVAGRAEQQRFWKAIARGLSSEDAAVSCGVSPPVGGRWFRGGGGMPPISLAPRSARYLSLAEREEIAILRAQGAGVRHMARRLRRAPSTVSRELRRNAATRSGGLAYRASTARWHSDRRAKRPKIAKLAATDRLRSYVQDRLAGTVMAEDGTPVPGPQRGLLEWSTSWPPPGPTLGDVVEPAADRPSAPDRVSRRCIDEGLARGPSTKRCISRGGGHCAAS